MERCEPDYMDLDDDGRYGFCNGCQCENPVVEQEQGFDHEFGFHSLPTEICATCGERI